MTSLQSGLYHLSESDHHAAALAQVTLVQRDRLDDLVSHRTASLVAAGSTEHQVDGKVTAAVDTHGLESLHASQRKRVGSCVERMELVTEDSRHSADRKAHGYTCLRLYLLFGSVDFLCSATAFAMVGEYALQLVCLLSKIRGFCVLVTGHVASETIVAEAFDELLERDWVIVLHESSSDLRCFCGRDDLYSTESGSHAEVAETESTYAFHRLSVKAVDVRDDHLLLSDCRVTVIFFLLPCQIYTASLPTVIDDGDVVVRSNLEADDGCPQCCRLLQALATFLGYLCSFEDLGSQFERKV